MSGGGQELVKERICSAFFLCPTCPFHGFSLHSVDLPNHVALLHAVINQILLGLFSDQAGS